MNLINNFYKLEKTHTCHFLLNFSIQPDILPMFSFNFFMEGSAVNFSKVDTYCVSVGLLPAKILCAPDFCKLHKQEVSRNVGEMPLPPDYYQRVCQKSYCFCSSQIFII
jgi:hypothetical protein